MEIENWKFFYHFSIFNFQLKVEMCKNNFCISILNWKLNGTFGARMSVYLNRVRKRLFHFCSIFNNFKQMKIDFGQFSIQFLIFQITKKIENWFFVNFQFNFQFLIISNNSIWFLVISNSIFNFFGICGKLKIANY